MLAIRARKLWLVAVVLLLTGSNGFVQFYKNCRVHRSLSMKLDPKSPKDNIQEQIRLNSKLLLQQLLLYGVIQSRPANAIGKLSEFSKQTMVIQDLLFNVQDAEKESEMMMALFQNTAKTIRSSTNSGEKKVVVAFGADAFDSPPNFFPGISNFLEAGGHATLSFRSKSVGDESEIFEKGNGLQFIKIGSELIRLSKGIEKG